MNEDKKIVDLKLKSYTLQNLEAFSQILDKTADEIVEEALESYFEAVQRELANRSAIDENAQTNLSYDEFWDGVEL